MKGKELGPGSSDQTPERVEIQIPTMPKSAAPFSGRNRDPVSRAPKFIPLNPRIGNRTEGFPSFILHPGGEGVLETGEW